MPAARPKEQDIGGYEQQDGEYGGYPGNDREGAAPGERPEHIPDNEYHTCYEQQPQKDHQCKDHGVLFLKV